MTLDYWIYAVTYTSLFGFLFFERYRLNGTVSLTKRDALYLIIEIIAKLIGLVLSLYVLLWFVNLVAPFEIMSVSNLSIPIYLNAPIAFLLVDFFHYCSHRLHHQVPLLWRLHRLHHADKTVDAMTTFLHHPFELISIFVVNFGCYVLFDIPVIIILVHTLVVAFHAPFSHTRILLAEKLNRVLSTFIITPNVHRIHHSLDMKESNSNFGNIFPFWDRLFGTYAYRNREPLFHMKYGISKNKSPNNLTLMELLKNPLK